MPPLTLALLLILLLLAGGWLLHWGWTLLRAAQLLVIMARGAGPVMSRMVYRIEVRTEHYPHSADDPVPYKIYRPLARSVAPAVVIFPGASPHGENHPAIDSLARAMAHAGLMVFVPRIPKLKEVIIDRSNVDSMRIFYRYIQGHEALSPGRISLVGTSFAGGLLLKALLDEGMDEPPPRAVLTYGTYCDLETTLRFILTGVVADGDVEVTVEPDRWGQVIFFYNYLEHVPGEFDRDAVRGVLGYYVQDRVEEGDEARAGLPAAERSIVDLILTPGNTESTALAEEVLEHARPLLEELSPSRFYHRIQFPFWVLHGRNDLMVPYTEALALKRLMPRQVRMYVSSLYAHREPEDGGGLWRTFRDTVGMVVYLGRFLRAAEG